jgi:hypothetical protein
VSVVELATQVERGAQREGHVGGGAAVAEVLLDRVAACSSSSSTLLR